MKQLLFLLSFFLVLQTISAQTNTPQNILFIFDASGSMWAKLGSSTKIQVAKETMAKISFGIPTSSQVGLIAYGHRSASDCNDIETLVTPGPFDKTKFDATIKALNPKGKTPIALSINHAIELIKKTKDPVTIILISDGLETCSGNACETIRIAKAAGLKITMHVVGFGIEEKDLSPLECIAQAGGGQYFPASNADELMAALEQTVKQIPVGNAYLSVHTTLEGKLKDATVQVFKKGQIKPIAGGRTYESKETNPRVLQLEAGTYDVEVNPVGIEGYAPIKLPGLVVPAGDTLFKDISFEQGQVEITVTRNGVLSDATIMIYPAGANKAIATTRSYSRSETNPAKIKIPPGVYDIVFSSVEISGRPEIKILKKELGSSGNLKFTHNFESGELKIGARKGAELVDATINIINTRTNKSVGAGRTYQSSGSNPKSFIIEPGKYLIELNPVKPAGLGKKVISIEIALKGTIEKIVEW